MRANFKICAQYLSAADKSLFARKQIAAVLHRTGGVGGALFACGPPARKR